MCATLSNYNCKLILPLKTLSTSMATTLYCMIIKYYYIIIVNIYEINIVAKSYILLWKTCESDPYLNVELLFHLYPKQYHNIIQSFFYDNKVYWDEYFLFICCFLFCDIYQITNLLLAMCKIHNNLIISKDQIQEFYILLSLTSKNFGETQVIYNYLDNLINNNTSSFQSIKYHLGLEEQSKIITKLYPLNNFVDYMNKSKSYQKIIIKFRQNIITSTLSLRIYKNIKLRQNFYDIYGGNKIPPSEPLISLLYRRLFTHEPPPYYYDFGLKVKKGNELNQVINGIRHIFGCSMRVRRCISMPTYLSNNEKNENKNLRRRKINSCELFTKTKCSNNDESKKIDVLKITDKSYYHKKQINFFFHSKITPFEECDDL